VRVVVVEGVAVVGAAVDLVIEVATEF